MQNCQYCKSKIAAVLHSQANTNQHSFLLVTDIIGLLFVKCFSLDGNLDLRTLVQPAFPFYLEVILEPTLCALLMSYSK